jgi:hypothetical protein
MNEKICIGEQAGQLVRILDVSEERRAAGCARGAESLPPRTFDPVASDDKTIIALRVF